MSYGHVTKVSRNDVLLSGPTPEVNGNDPLCKRVGYHNLTSFTPASSSCALLCKNFDICIICMITAYVYLKVESRTSWFFFPYREDPGNY